MARIKTGTGNGGYGAKVDIHNRMHTDSVTKSESAHAVSDGNGYNINTGVVGLTTAGASGLLYVKNTDINDLIIESFIYMLGNNTGGDAGDHTITVYRNPTGGTLLSGGSDITTRVVNRNHSSNKTLTGTFLKGAEGSTIVGTEVLLETILTGSGRTVIPVGAIVLPQGTSLAVEVTPRTNTSAMNVELALSAYEREVL